MPTNSAKSIKSLSAVNEQSLIAFLQCKALKNQKVREVVVIGFENSFWQQVDVLLVVWQSNV